MLKDIKRFGVMMDCSRNAVKTVADIKRFIDLIVKMGYNTLELYTEDTYEIPDEPYFGYLRGAYSATEIREIDGYAKSKGVELIPCIQTLAHLNCMLKMPAYSAVKDVDDILLIDEPKTYELIEKMFAFAAENFTSRLINIGMDEAHMVGLGKYLDKHGYKDRYEILLGHLNKVVEIAKKYGFKPHMWSDMFFRLATGGYALEEPVQMPQTVLEKIPEDVALVYWDYYTTSASAYDAMFLTHNEFNREVWFAGGGWTWVGFAPFNKRAMERLQPAIESAVKHGTANILMTVWGDDGGECSYYSALPSLYAARCYADGIFDLAEIKKGFFELFGVEFDVFMEMEAINDTERNRRETFCENPCKSLLYNDCFLGTLDVDLQNAGALSFKKSTARLQKARKGAKEYVYLFDSLIALSKLLEVKGYLGTETREVYQSKDKEKLGALIKKYDLAIRRLQVFYDTYKKQWFIENKPFGWEVQDVRLGGVMQRLRYGRDTLKAFYEGKIKEIPELEAKLLPYANTLFRQYYQKIITTNTL